MYTGYRIDRRRHQRLRVDLTMFYEIEAPIDLCLAVGDREFEAKTFDLSEGGLSFLTEHYLPTDARILTKLILFEFDHTGLVKSYDPIEICGIVRSSFYTYDNQFRVGVSFEGIDESLKSRIADFVHSSLRPVGV